MTNDFIVFFTPTGIQGISSLPGVQFPPVSPRLGLTDLDRQVQSLTVAGLAQSTIRCYNSGVNRYLKFCNVYNVSSFPLTELVLCHFVVFLIREGIFYSAIRQYLSALWHHQLLSGGSNPAFSSLPRLHYILRGSHHSLPSSVPPQTTPDHTRGAKSSTSTLVKQIRGL